MVFSLFRKQKNDDFIKPPITVEPPHTDTAPVSNGPGRMSIQDVFFIKGRGTVVTGHVESGSFSVGQSVIIETAGAPIETTIKGIETFHKTMDTVTAGDNAGIVLNDVDPKSVNKGDIISTK